MDDPLLVACLCAEWCTACRAYRAVFDQAAAEHPGLRFAWVDIDDEAALFDGVDVENFPTLLIGAGDRPRFYGAIPPHREVLAKVIAAHLGPGSGSADHASEIVALLRRLQCEAG